MTANILVVDDTPANVDVLEAKLQSEYFIVTTASSGEECLQKVAQEKPDLILLDIMMPGMTGYEVCERLKSDPKTAHIPIIMVTALNGAEDRLKGLQVGADDFLTKPAPTQTLMARVRSLLRVKMTLDELRRRSNDPCADLNIAKIVADTRALLVDDRPGEAVEKVLRTRLKLNCARLRDQANLRDQVAKGADLVIVNATFNKGSGLSLCRYLRTNPAMAHAAIVALVEADNPERIAEALDAGADDYVIRPVDENELSARVSAQLKRKRYADRLRDGLDARLLEATIDPLTKLHNRRYATPHLINEINQCQSVRAPLSVLLLDIDHFKQINDVHGHGVGDQVLTQVAERIRKTVGADTLAARIGGEEFLVGLPGATAKEACMAAEAIKHVIGGYPFPVRQDNAARDELAVTVSIGVAEIQRPIDSLERLLTRADKALYESKRAGRNRVMIAAAEVSAA